MISSTVLLHVYQGQAIVSPYVGMVLKILVSVDLHVYTVYGDNSAMNKINDT